MKSPTKTSLQRAARIITIFAATATHQHVFGQTEVAKLVPVGPEAAEFFGQSVAMKGDIAVVGSPHDGDKGEDAGAAYVFRFDTALNEWRPQQKLVANGGAAGDLFGTSVAISVGSAAGDTIWIGAPFAGDNASGAAYVFDVVDSIWEQRHIFVETKGVSGDRVGAAVAADRTWAAVGAPGFLNSEGRVRGFTFLNSTWVKVDVLVGDMMDGDQFGSSVALFTNPADETAKVVVGTPGDDDNGENSGTAFVFHVDNPNQPEQKLTSFDGAGVGFGSSVAIHENTIIVGQPFDGANGLDSGAAYVFGFLDTSWLLEGRLEASNAQAGDLFGLSVAVGADEALIGTIGDDDSGPDAGAAYVFKRFADSWFEEQKLLATDGAADDAFGIAVAIDTDEDRLIVGADLDDDIEDDSGSAHTFHREGLDWAPDDPPKLLAFDGHDGDGLGRAVSVSGDVALVGAWLRDDNDNQSGAAHVYRFDAATQQWLQEQKLLASDSQTEAWFGFSVAVDGDAAVVGAPEEDQGLPSSAGAIYVFREDGNDWEEEQRLTAFDAAVGDHLGESVAISGDLIIAGAALVEPDNTGAAYAFRFNGGQWITEHKFFASDGQDDDHFGGAVAVSGDVTVIGARLHDDNGADSGAAYIYRYNGATWFEEQKLFAFDGAGVQYGSSVAIDGATIVVGAPFPGSTLSSAYVYTFDGVDWVFEQKLAPPDVQDDLQFGSSVSICGDVIVVGAANRHTNGELFSGAAYVFERQAGQWQQVETLTASDAADGQRLGASVSIDGATVLAGAPTEVSFETICPDPDEGDCRPGAAYVFDVTPAGNGVAAADLNSDGVIDALDLIILLGDWGVCDDCKSCPADLDNDCNVGAGDLILLLGNWG